MERREELKFRIIGGKAAPGGNLSASFGQRQVDTRKFCEEFNLRTKQENITGTTPVHTRVEVMEKGKFRIVSINRVSIPDALREFCPQNKGGSKPGKEVAGYISQTQLKTLAVGKIVDMKWKIEKTGPTAEQIQKAMSVVEGTARSMGIKVVNDNDLEKFKIALEQQSKTTVQAGGTKKKGGKAAKPTKK